MPNGRPPHAVIATAVRQERERADLSQAELARRAGLAKSTLSQLEAGTGNPSVETVWALATALDVPFSQLVTDAAPAVQVVRAGDGIRLRSERTEFVSTLLAPGSRHTRRDLYVIELDAGTVRDAAPHPVGSVEHVVVTAGRLRTGPRDQPVELVAGDYASFPGDVPHWYEGLAEQTRAVLLMDHP